MGTHGRDPALGVAARRLRLGVLCLAAPVLLAWGERGHRAVTATALKALPPEVAAWFAGRGERLQEASVEPDRWRAHDRKEGPRHYLDVEYYGLPADIPRQAEAALAKVGGAAFAKAGQAPWVIQDGYRQLVSAFRAGDAAQVADRAAWLGHYVADLHVPLHTTTNHDGQLTDQPGIHGRWESGLVERYLEEAALLAAPAVPEDPATAPWRWLEESFALIPRVLADDREAGRGETRTQPVRSVGYWRNYWALQGPVVARRLGEAGQRLAGLWLAAWQEAGRPRVGPGR